MAEEEWDTGADQDEFEQDKFNKFDPTKVVVDAPQETEIVKSEPKPEVKPIAIEPVAMQPTPMSKPPPQNRSTGSVSPRSPPSPPRRTGSSPNNRPMGSSSSPRVNKLKTAPPVPKVAVPEPPRMVNKKVADTISAPRTFSTRLEEPANKGTAFTEKLDAEALAYFSDLCQKPFSVQAVAFLNAYWPEVGSQSEFIFSCAWEKI